MIKKILQTVGTRYVIALLNLLLIFINARVLGVEGVGMAGIILASVNFATIFNGILAGNTIVYFMNRYSIRYILSPIVIWSLFGSGFAAAAMLLFGMIPSDYAWDVALLSLLGTLVTVNARFLLGRDRITGFNLTFLLQGGLLFFVLLFIYYVMKEQSVRAYLHGMYVTNGIALLASTLLVLPLLRKEQGQTEGKRPASRMKLIREMFAYGLWAGVDNLAEVFTTRLNYFFINRYGGLGSVGLLDAGTKISESVWRVSQSISFIEYGEVARTADPEQQRRTTVKLFRITLCALVTIMAIILCIPEWIYTDYLFTSEFAGMRRVIIGLSVGIVALGCNSILSHYFIGSGRVKISACSSCTGIVTLLIAGSLLIPAYGIMGSALSTSIAFTAMFLFSLIRFRQITRTALREMLPDRSDLHTVVQLVRQRFRKAK